MNGKCICENIKKEFFGWKPTEILGIFFVLGIILFNKVVLHDSTVAVISAVCGFLYTVLAGKGKISCYLFGLTGSAFYGYLAFANSLFGNLALYVLYYIPMQIAGIFNWKNHLKKETNEIYKTSLETSKRFVLVVSSVLLCVLICGVLVLLKDSHPVLDGCATALSLVGMYLTVKRCIEQWVVWFIVNLLSVIMWISVINSGTRAYSTVLMWFVYLLLSVYFYTEWKKEITE